MTDTDSSDTKLEIALILCGGCECRSLKEDAERAAESEWGPNVPHCPRCGTRLENEDTVVEHWVNQSVDTETERTENRGESVCSTK